MRQYLGGRPEQWTGDAQSRPTIGLWPGFGRVKGGDARALSVEQWCGGHDPIRVQYSLKTLMGEALMRISATGWKWLRTPKDYCCKSRKLNDAEKLAKAVSSILIRNTLVPFAIRTTPGSCLATEGVKSPKNPELL